jgi:hypothetical protein
MLVCSCTLSGTASCTNCPQYVREFSNLHYKDKYNIIKDEMNELSISTIQMLKAFINLQLKLSRDEKQ